MISVIVPAYNAAETIQRSLKAIRDATSAQIELVVIDDGSTDDTSLACDGLVDTLVRCERRQGAAAARNIGRKHCVGELLVFVDADVEPRPGSLDRLVAGMGDRAAAFGSYGSLPPESVRNWTTLYKNHLHHLTHQEASPEVSTFWSGFGVVRSDAFDEVGGFPQRAICFADVEDIRLGYELRSAGHSITVVPGAQVDHHKRFTPWSLAKTDLLHRAIPWTDAMLSSHTFRSELAVGPAAIVSSCALWAATFGGLGALGSSGLRSPALVVLAVSLGVWVVANRRLFISAARSFDSKAAVAASAALHAMQCLYAPIGAAAGVAVHFGRRLAGRRR